MEKTNKYTVAGHTFAVCLSEDMDAGTYLHPYEPFYDGSDAQPLFSLTLRTVSSFKELNPGKVRECLNDEAPYFWIFQRDDGSFNFGFSYSKNAPDCILIPSSDYRDNVVYVKTEHADRFAGFALNNAMMLLYTFCTTSLDTLMVHASVVMCGGKGYMFLGKSGTGKSTHSSLWLKNIPDTELLNDDNPVVRVLDGETYVYGTPWSGKTPCYKNIRLPLGAVVRLSQAPYNRIRPVCGLEAFASLMPACSCMRWDGTSVSMLYNTVEKVISANALYDLECLPDRDAVVTCHAVITKQKL